MLAKLKEYFSREEQVPSEEFLWEACNACPYTPDISLLERYEAQCVFIADDLMSSFKNHSILRPFVIEEGGHAFTRDNFLMWKKSLGLESFPIPVVSKPSDTSIVHWMPKPARIKGELYLIHPQGFIELDKHRLNGVQFYRKRIRLVLPYQRVKQNAAVIGRDGKYLLSKTELALNNPEEAPVVLTERKYHNPSAWMYIGREEFWNDQFDAGWSGLTKVSMFRPKDVNIGTEYYHFTKYEQKE